MVRESNFTFDDLGDVFKVLLFGTVHVLDVHYELFVGLQGKVEPGENIINILITRAGFPSSTRILVLKNPVFSALVSKLNTDFDQQGLI